MVGVKTHLEAKPILKWHTALFRNTNELPLWSPLGLLHDALHTRHIPCLNSEAFWILKHTWFPGFRIRDCEPGLLRSAESYVLWLMFSSSDCQLWNSESQNPGRKGINSFLLEVTDWYWGAEGTRCKVVIWNHVFLASLLLWSLENFCRDLVLEDNYLSSPFQFPDPRVPWVLPACSAFCLAELGKGKQNRGLLPRNLPCYWR